MDIVASTVGSQRLCGSRIIPSARIRLGSSSGRARCVSLLLLGALHLRQAVVGNAMFAILAGPCPIMSLPKSSSTADLKLANRHQDWQPFQRCKKIVQRTTLGTPTLVDLSQAELMLLGVQMRHGDVQTIREEGEGGTVPDESTLSKARTLDKRPHHRFAPTLPLPVPFARNSPNSGFSFLSRASHLSQALPEEETRSFDSMYVVVFLLNVHLQP